jgi:ribonuclease D
MRSHIVDTPEHLKNFLDELGSAALLALDTEFLRVKTYYPRLCLIQVSAGGAVYCLDPLGVEINRRPVRDVICSQDKTTVFHAARQDLEVIFLAVGDVPRRVFDTQIAAAMAGFGDQVSYAELVGMVTGRELAKAHTRTDWCRRPLSREQINYAVDDVRYLEPIHEFLSAELERRGRLGWVFEECGALSDIEQYRADPSKAYRRIGHGDRLDPAAQSVLKELAIWRERTSQRLDLPRNWIVKDGVLAMIARQLPSSPRQLSAIDGVSAKFVRRYGDAIVELVREVLGRDSHPVIWRKKSPLTQEQRALQKKIVEYMNRVAADAGISPGLLGTRQDVARLVRGNRKVNLMSGWRGRLLGEELHALLG